MPATIPICLIGGTGRSGTTILKRIFSKHPDVASIPEWRFSIDPDGPVDFYNTFLTGWSPQLFDIRLKRLEKYLKTISRNKTIWNYYRIGLKRVGIRGMLNYNLVPRYSDVSVMKVCPDFNNHVESFIQNLTDFQFRGHWTGMGFLEKRRILYGGFRDMEELARIIGNFLNSVIQSALDVQGKKFYVEDNTWNILWFHRMLDLLPGARLIHIYRDPRDVVCSFMKQTWAPSDPAQAAFFYKGIIETWWNVRKKLPKATYREISLESLVENPKKILKEACGFWNIPWDESLLKTDLGRSHSGRWKKDLSPEEQDKVNEILTDQIKALGYSL